MVLAISLVAFAFAIVRGAIGWWRGESIGTVLFAMAAWATMSAIGIALGKWATSDDQDD